MADVLERIEQNRKRLQELKSQRDKLQGKKEQLLSDLKKNHQVGTLVEAQAKENELAEYLKKSEKELETLVEKMEAVVAGG